jgi:hypothetical protein
MDAKKIFLQRRAIMNQLPTNGIVEIKKESGVSKPTIYKFFYGKKVRSNLAEKIIEAIIKVLTRELEKSNLTEDKLNSLIGGGGNYQSQNT